MSIRFDIASPDGTHRTGTFTGPGPWTIGGHGASVNLAGADGVLTVRREPSGVLVADDGRGGQRRWSPDASIAVGGYVLRLLAAPVGADDETVALTRPTADALASMAVRRPSSPRGATHREPGTASHSPSVAEARAGRPRGVTAATIGLAALAMAAAALFVWVLGGGR